MLYELLTGQPPFTGESAVAIAYQHVRKDPIPPSRVNSELPPWADSIVLKAMKKDPNDRYQSAEEMHADVQRALQGLPLATTVGTDNQQSTGRIGSIEQARMISNVAGEEAIQERGGHSEWPNIQSAASKFTPRHRRSPKRPQ
jgi:serine/threonine-protein kinase